MADWRFVTDEEDEVLRTNPLEPVVDASGPDLEDLNIYKVVEGHVSPYSGGVTQDIAQIVPPGWFARILDEEHAGYTYDGSGLQVEMHGNTVELKRGTLVTLFPPEHLEKARELAAPTSD